MLVASLPVEVLFLATSNSLRCRKLPDGVNERVGGTGECAVTAIGYAQFAPEFFAFDRNQLDASGKNLVFGEAGADYRNAEAGGHEALDHPNARKLHSDLHFSCIRAE